jgi:hypothetical protein
MSRTHLIAINRISEAVFPHHLFANPFRQPSQAQMASVISAMKGGEEQQRKELRDKQTRPRRSDIRSIWERRNNQAQASEEGFLS